MYNVLKSTVGAGYDIVDGQGQIANDEPVLDRSIAQQIAAELEDEAFYTPAYWLGADGGDQ